jgi:hypothetical protein
MGFALRTQRPARISCDDRACRYGFGHYCADVKARSAADAQGFFGMDHERGHRPHVHGLWGAPCKSSLPLSTFACARKPVTFRMGGFSAFPVRVFLACEARHGGGPCLLDE